LHLQNHSAVAVCAMVQQGLGLAIVNPLTALAMAGPGLAVRRLAFSVPFSVNALLPLYRTALPETQPLVQSLQAQAQEATHRLHSLLDSPAT
jgi:DNA-binding transcriptional LysR family regulator